MKAAAVSDRAAATSDHGCIVAGERFQLRHPLRGGGDRILQGILPSKIGIFAFSKPVIWQKFQVGVTKLSGKAGCCNDVVLVVIKAGDDRAA